MSSVDTVVSSPRVLSKVSNLVGNGGMDGCCGGASGDSSGLSIVLSAMVVSVAWAWFRTRRLKHVYRTDELDSL